jgi:hypothetical protein
VKQKLHRLQEILALRKEWQEKMSQIQRMQTWVIETEHILAGDWIKEGEDLTNQMVAERFDAWLATLQAQLSGEETITEIEKECLMHFLQISRNLRPRLICCYDVPGLPRTNNEMEGYIRGLKTRYRRVSGRKNWNAYLLRYGQSIAYFDSFEQAGFDEHAFFTCFCRVDHQVWRETRDHHRSIQSDRLNVFRFRQKPEQYLQELENRWEQTLTGTGVLP